MALTQLTVATVAPLLPSRILALGWPDHLVEHVDMTGSTLDVVDIVPQHGGERIADLSKIQDLGKYDLVLDCGTLEHVANIAHGFINAASAVALNGHILHHIPLNMINHGYWNISPVWLTDFYKVNGFKIHRLERTSDAPYDQNVNLPWPNNQPTAYYYSVPEPSLILCLAQRIEVQPIVLPTCQSMWL